MSANTKPVEKPAQTRAQTPPSRKATIHQASQGDLKVDDQGQPRPPTPFQELQGSSREGSINNNAEERVVTPPPDAARDAGRSFVQH